MMSRTYRSPSIDVWLSLAAVMALVGILMVSGCGVRQLAKLEPPDVRLQGMSLQPPTNQGIPLTVVLALQNPNPTTIKVLGYDYEVRAAGQSVARGVGDQPVILPARGETTVAVPVLLRLRAIPGLAPYLLQDKKIPVEIAGGFRLPQTLGFRVPFRFREQLTLQEGLDELSPFLGR
jgi:LEA14-like dessication related protein